MRLAALILLAAISLAVCGMVGAAFLLSVPAHAVRDLHHGGGR